MVFKSSRSTADILAIASDRIVGAFNKSVTIRAVSLDISRVFVKVWHAGLINKFKSLHNFRFE